MHRTPPRSLTAKSPRPARIVHVAGRFRSQGIREWHPRLREGNGPPPDALLLLVVAFAGEVERRAVGAARRRLGAQAAGPEAVPRVVALLQVHAHVREAVVLDPLSAARRRVSAGASPAVTAVVRAEVRRAVVASVPVVVVELLARDL